MVILRVRVVAILVALAILAEDRMETDRIGTTAQSMTNSYRFR
jgi:hypothetical protein